VYEPVQAEIFGGEALELLVVADLVRCGHPEGAHGHELALVLNGVDGVGETILLKVVFGLDFDGVVLVGVDFLAFGRLLLLALGLAVEEDGLGVAGEGQSVELVGVVSIELVEGRQFLELEVVLAALGHSNL
jgi:hypothetical protein